MKKATAKFGRRAVVRASYISLSIALGFAVIGGAQAFAAPQDAAQADAPVANGKKAPVKKAAKANADTSQGDQTGAGGAQEVIVTGVIGATKARKANAAYTSLGQEDIDRFVPISAEDMLADIPGVVVESNDGVTRNEVYTRGMTVGTGTNTTGNFWTTIMEDSLPVVPQKWGGFQDGYFYRADITTAKVESVRGGSTATTASSSVGGTFNFISAGVRPGASIQTRMGWEGEDSHLSWREVSGYYGWVNTDNTYGFSLSGFKRVADGAVDPGYDLNNGGQVKAQLFKKYDAGNWGAGKVTVYLKHLDDTNNVRTNFAQPAYNYTESPEMVPGWTRDTDLYLHDPQQHTVWIGPNQSIDSDPSQGHRYRSDALTVKWEHNFNNGWRFENSVKIQTNKVDSDISYSRDVVPLGTRANFEQMALWNGTGNNGLLYKAGTFTLYDRETGAVRATLTNNTAGSQLGTNYRTGVACPRQTSTTTSSICITSSNLPNRDFDVHGGLIFATNPAKPATYLKPVNYPANGLTSDLIMTTRGELAHRQSNDALGNFQLSRSGEKIQMTMGVYIDRSVMDQATYGQGQGISAWASGEVSNLGVKFTDTTGKVYQVTDEGGWGGAGQSTQILHATYNEFSPYIGVAWSPDEHWDLNFSYKYTQVNAKTYAEIWSSNAAYLAQGGVAGVPTLTTANYTQYKDQTFGGVDGNPLTLYDNGYYVYDPAKVFRTKKSYIVRNVSGSVGYNFNSNNKVYYRYTDGQQSVQGVVTRYTSVASLTRPLGPTAGLVQHELSYNHRGRIWSPTITAFYSTMEDPYLDYGIDINGVDTYQTELLVRTYFTRGIEYYQKLYINKFLQVNSSVTFNNGKNTAYYQWSNLGATGLGAADDTLTVTSAPLIRVANWSSSNTFIMSYKDWRANLRHRYMSARRTSNNPQDPTTLPAQNLFDMSFQYVGLKDTMINFEIRNLTDSNAISSISNLVRPTNLTDVQPYDIVNQLPDSATSIKLNPPRSFWLTIKHDF